MQPSSADLLAMDGGRWQREPVVAVVSILDAPRTWREFADSEDRTNPTLAESYRRLADEMDQYLALKGVQ